MSESSPPKVLVIGWDGADWRILRPLMEQGRLPNLTALVARAAHGELLSTVPAVTGPAWASFITGRWPANHGLLGWQLPLNARLERPWVNASTLQGTTIWELLSAAGWRLGVLNVPLTYPPPALNGELISGMLTPSTASSFTHPAGLRQELLAACPGYVLDVELQRTERDTRSARGIQRFLREVAFALEQREKALDFLWRRGPFDFFMVVFETPDRLQHPLYQFAAGVATELRPDWQAVRERVVELYARCDAALGSVLARAGEETTIILLSDHGFGPLRAVWHLNDWLAEQGYLTWAGDGLRTRQRGILRRVVAPIRHRLPQSWLRRGREAFAPLKLVNWQATAAYAGLPTEEGVWLNVRGREPSGIVAPGASYERLRDELIAALESFRDPHTGDQVIRRAWRREEVHDGPLADRAPDIVLTLNEGFKVTPGLAPKGPRPKGPRPKGLGRTGLVDDVAAQGNGIHRREGIVVIAGPGVTPGPLAGAGLPDLLPTILSAAGLDSLAEIRLDGRVLIAPREGREDRRTGGRGDGGTGAQAGFAPAHTVADAGAELSKEDAALIAARLADLGYLE